MTGRRISDPGDRLCEPGDYYKDASGEWRGQAPNGLYVWLKNHKVVEQDDGTITVSPSILASNGSGNKQWHGYLERGNWREC